VHGRRTGRLLRSAKQPAIPIVILTTSGSERDVATAYAHHANSYVVKPVDFEQFTRLMSDLGYYWLGWNHCKAPPMEGTEGTKVSTS
jgi:CheY-like chemotaxis protein